MRSLCGLLGGAVIALSSWLPPPILAASPDDAPIKLGLDAEFGVMESTSAQAVRVGMQIAIDEINGAGGVLGRKMALIEKDNRSVPARARTNLRQLAADPAVVAVFCGKYSPVVVETLPDIHDLKLPLLVPWAAADPITENGYQPSYVFRLSLRDSWAIRTFFNELERRDISRVGLLLPNTEWGRSSLRAADELASASPKIRISGHLWYNWGDESLAEPYQALRAGGAQALVLVANEREGSILANQIALLPPAERLPILSHWGVTGGRMFQLAGPALRQLDFSVVQTYSFLDAKDEKARHVAAAAVPLFQQAGIAVKGERTIPSPVGVAHAYDLTHILARAITLAGSTDRGKVRDALEKVTDYPGLIRRYDRPFTAERHDALDPQQPFLARYGEDGALEPIRTP